MTGSKTVENARSKKASESDERRLVEAAQSDAARFVDLYEKYFAVVYGFIARRVPDRAETEDLAAEVFRKALTSLPRFKWTGAPFGAWLIRIASNMIADRAKRVAREGKVASDETRDAPLTRSMQQKELEISERRAQLYRLVEELADDQRSVIVMRFAEEKSIRDIAGEIGRSEGAVKQLQFRALHNLRAKLGQSE
jgi:RNA polymerase sigma-70 factor (ECF subfamily)